jgi:transglutaminase-like putative cysteine protease
MRIRTGFEIVYDCPAPAPMILMLNVHPSRRDRLENPDTLRTDPELDVHQYLDGFGNLCSRIVAPPGRLTLSADFVVVDSGLPDEVTPDAEQHAVEDLPDDVLVYLLGSRYCETDLLSNLAWNLFQHTPPGWARVQAIVDFAHNHIVFGYEHARASKTAHEAYMERRGVCRDYTHLAVALCRCMNIPARYCTGYLADIAVPPLLPMDFSAWFEVWLGGAWRTFDARNNKRRIGRVLMATGRDAADVALATTFGPAFLERFIVVSDEIIETP